jgi:serine O-acetyltransferase
VVFPFEMIAASEKPLEERIVSDAWPAARGGGSPTSYATRAAAYRAAFGVGNQNPAHLSFWSLLREDLRTHDGNVFDQGFWAIAVHRFGNWRMGLRLKLLRAPCTLLYVVLAKLVEMFAGITLPYTCRIGRRTRVWHHSGLIISAYAIGDECHLRQNTTMGVVRRDQNYEIPIVEDRVDIGCGACLLGGIVIGHDSVIGANAVVLEDVPPYSVVVGVPGKVIRTRSPLE